MGADDELIELAEANYLGSWRVLASRAPGGEVEEDDDLLLVAVPVPVPMFNSAFVKPHADPADHVDRIRAFYGDRGRPYLVRVRGEQAVPGLVPEESAPVMVAAVAEVEEITVDGLDVVLATTPAEWRDVVVTMAAGFEAPLEMIEAILPAERPDDADLVGFVGYVDGRPVTTAALSLQAGVAGIYNVGTPPEHRRHGWADVVTRAAVAEGARRGCAFATLQSSAMGYGVYERMGFRAVTRWTSHQLP